MMDIFTTPSKQEVPVDSALLGDAYLSSETGAPNMTVESLFRRLIREVLAEPVAGQKYKSTPRMPVTMASGKSIEITNVSGPEEDKVITFTVDDGSGKIYTIQRRWSDVVNGGGEWFTESKKNSKKKKTIEVGSTKTKRCKNCEKPHLENKKCECGVK